MESALGIAFSPLLPLWQLALLVLPALLLLLLAAKSRARGAGWRTLVLAILLLGLLGPSVSREQRRPLPDVAALIVDRSESQAIGERGGQTDEAEAALVEALAALSDLETRVAVLPRTDGAEGTRLFDAAARLLADVPPERLAGTILLTDGQVHDAPAGEGAASLGPLHVLLTGAPDERDRRLALEQAPGYGIVGDEVTLTVRVIDDHAQGEPVTLLVSVDGAPARRMPLRIGEASAVTVPIDHAGATAIELTVGASDDELTVLNNRVVAVVNGVRDRLRVMLVSGEPNAGLRSWRNLLKADPSVDLVHLTILRPPNTSDLTPVRELSLIPFPADELFAADLGKFDLVIFDSYHRRGILPMLYLENVVDYVLGGGAVLDAAGPAFASPLSLASTPLGNVLPARPNGQIHAAPFLPRLTDTGYRHPVTNDLSGNGADTGQEPEWGRWFRHIGADLRGGIPLMEGFDSQPLLVLERVGDGRVAQLLSDQSWLWAKGFEGGGPQSDMLRRLVHWLMKEPDLEEEDLVAEALDGQIVITRRSLTPVDGALAITGPDGAKSELALEERGDGTATLRLAEAAPGLWRFGHDGHTAIAVLGAADSREMEDVRATEAILGPLAEATGGGVVWLAEDGVPGLRKVRAGRTAEGRGWLGLVERRRHLVTGLDQHPLLPAWLLLALALGGLLVAWRSEGR